ncbi:hypothetical protein LCGC14_2629900 [marine sediment metagenome]|uniref:Uncharacterized protein n=1 Tax=marine sediment metagenome TaxID=412755 RepID=A0A0F9CT01_9ZZZZ
MLISTDAIVEAVGNSVRRALDSGGEVEFKTEASMPLMWPEVPFVTRGLPTVTTLVITGWTTVEATYYHTDAERWAKFYGDMVDDPQAARG